MLPPFWEGKQRAENSERDMMSFSKYFHKWLQWKLSKWQLPVLLVTKNFQNDISVSVSCSHNPLPQNTLHICVANMLRSVQFHIIYQNLHSECYNRCAYYYTTLKYPWWRHQMEAVSALVAFSAGNSPVTGEFPTQRPVTRSFGALFGLSLNQQLSKQRRRWWFETPSHSLWHHCNV